MVRSKSLLPFLRDSEFKLYASLIVIISSLSIYVLSTQSVYHDFSTAFREGLFQSVSIATTSGFVTSDYSSWPVFIPVLLLFASFIGGCAGSTGGGMKVIRVLLLIKQGQREIMRLIHPNAQVTVKIGRQPVKNSIIDAVWGFFAAYVALFA